MRILRGNSRVPSHGQATKSHIDTENKTPPPSPQKKRDIPHGVANLLHRSSSFLLSAIVHITKKWTALKPTDRETNQTLKAQYRIGH